MTTDSFKNGISFYTHACANIVIHFPENKIKCQYCRFCRSENDLKRFWCRLTEKMIYDPFAPGLPDECPFEILEE